MFLFFTLAKGIYMHKENNTYYIYSCITQRIPSKCQVKFAGWIEKKIFKNFKYFPYSTLYLCYWNSIHNSVIKSEIIPIYYFSDHSKTLHSFSSHLFTSHISPITLTLLFFFSIHTHTHTLFSSSFLYLFEVIIATRGQ